MRPALEWKDSRRDKTTPFDDSAGPPRVLVAEDDPEMRDLIASALTDEGFDVLQARDGRELVEILGAMLPPTARLQPPDVIITDIRMPGPSGLEGLAILRQSSWAVPVIVITAFGDLATHAEARRLGAAVVLDKPFDLDVLRTAVISVAPPW